MTANAGGPEPSRLNNTPETARRGRIPADTFPNRLVLARRLAGMTIREAAQECGLNYGSWSNWENGKRPVDILDVVQRVAEHLDIDEEWLLWGGPLEGPRGRRTADRSGLQSPSRVGEDTDRYPGVPTRPMSTRPSQGRPNNRRDGRAPHSHRPVIVDHPTTQRIGLATGSRERFVGE